MVAELSPMEGDVVTAEDFGMEVLANEKDLLFICHRDV